MHSVEQLTQLFAERFSVNHFPAEPATLYDPNRYFLTLGGKRIRPLLVLMGNELVEDIKEDAWHAANAVELFHNFTLIHDDIMDAAALRRGMPTVHHTYGQSTAILAGDVMLVKAYEYLNMLSRDISRPVISLFNKTAAEVCEGQQLDMDFENREDVTLPDYLRMIRLKTSVLLAGALQMGAIIGGAGRGNQDHLYAFGENLGIAFQVQDDYLDAFGDPEKFGKEPGGDIRQNKKTFLAIHTWEVASPAQREQLKQLAADTSANKVPEVLAIMKSCGVDEWARNLKQEYFEKAMYHLEEVAVMSGRKKTLHDLAHFLISRDH
ncbi:MAG TPA: polyprenyl synthetase family protein [Phnomibacter sp.]|nr:polyprenyl synthetase family protein [Phnomibacter sp.]